MRSEGCYHGCMRARCLSGLWQRLAVCGLLFGANIAAAESEATVSEPGPLAFPLVTNIAQLRPLGSQEGPGVFSFRLEGAVLWVNAAQGRLVLQDGSGAEELEMELGGVSLAAGDRVKVGGTGMLGRSGAAFRLGIRGPVVDNDGLHKTEEMTGALYLRTGRYPLRVDWFNGTGKPGLDVTYEGPGISRRKIPDGTLWRDKLDTETGSSNMVHGVAYRCYEGDWEKLPDFSLLKPVKTGTLSNFNLKGARSRDKNVGVQFTTYVDVSTEGVYTFYLKSAGGSRLYLGEPAFEMVVVGQGGLPTAGKITLDQKFAEGADNRWGKVDGKVTSAREGPNGLRFELSSGVSNVRMEVAGLSGAAAEGLVGQWVRATGFCESGFAPDGQKVPTALLVPSEKELERIAAPAENQSGAAAATNGEALPLLTSAAAVRQLRPEESQRGYPLKIQGVVTCVQLDHHAFVVQDSTMGLYLVDSEHPGVALPQVGEFLAVEGLTDGLGILKVSRLKHLGAGKMPEPRHPTWSQLLNGSHDSQWVEIGGLVESVVNRSNGWSRVELRMGQGSLRIDVRNAGVNPGPIEKYNNAAIRLRGCMFADWAPGTLRLKVGQIRMYDAEVTMDRVVSADVFSLPLQPVSELHSI